MAQDTVLSNVLTFTVSAVTAINPEPATALGIQWYPNPVMTTLNINGLQLIDKWQTIDITSIDGKQSLISAVISNRTRASINVKQLPAGIYVAILRRKEGAAVVLRFIKL